MTHFVITYGVRLASYHRGDEDSNGKPLEVELSSGCSTPEKAVELAKARYPLEYEQHRGWHDSDLVTWIEAKVVGYPRQIELGRVIGAG